MIERHLLLSCYTLEHPFQPEYAHFGEEIVDLIDSNNDIYEFRLADTELYEKIDGGGHLKQLKRIGSLSFMLYQTGTLVVRRRNEELYILNDIDQIEMLRVDTTAIVVLRSNCFFAKHQLRLQIGFITEDQQNEQKQLSIKIQTYILEEETAEHDHFQKYVSHFGGTMCKIEKLINKCCLVVDNHGQKLIFRLNYHNIANCQWKKVKYTKLEFELHQNFSISSNFRDYLLVYSGKESYLLDSEHERIVLIKDLDTNGKDIEYIIYNSFMIAITANNLSIFETIKGNKMAEINIDAILEQFEEGSSIILKEELKRDMRYGLLYDNLKIKLTHFYLLDKEKLALFYFNINKLLERGFIKTIKENLQTLESDDDKYHENIMKTINFRIKKLETLEKYLLEDLKTNNFANTVRFLINEQTIYVLNDGLSLFYHAVISNTAKIMTQKQSIAELERDLVKICHRLVTESNYENQIANGLHILNGIYTNFRKYQQTEGLEKNKQCYSKLLQSNRVTKLLKNEKKKKLFELSYQLALKVKGYKYLQGLQSMKGK